MVLVRPGCLKWQQDSGGNCCYYMLTFQGLHISKTLLILSKYTNHVAFRKWNTLFKIYFVLAQAEKKEIKQLLINWFRTCGESWLSEQLNFCARSWPRFLYVLLLELLMRSFTVFNVSYIVESSNNILIIFVHFGFLLTNCKISKPCLHILKVDTKMSNNGESSLLLEPALTIWDYQNTIFINVSDVFVMLCLYVTACFLS